jgi:hypothetical protein
LVLVREDPKNQQFQRDLHSALEPLSSTLLHTGNRQEARQITVELLAGLRPLIERPDPSPYDLHRYCWAVLNTPFTDLHNRTATLRLAQKAVDLTHGSDPAILNVLALAWEANGYFTKAAETERRARTLVQAGTKRTEMENNLARFEREMAKMAAPARQ